MRVLSRVSVSAFSHAATSRSETCSRSPTMRMRTPRSASLVRYLAIATSASPIRPDTSSVGRFQFSDENANTVRYSMPRSAQPSTVLTSVSTPALWPKKRGMKRFRAQRPLPSMTMATWRGTATFESTASDRHDVGFFRRDQPIDLGDRAVGELLQLVERAALFVLGDFLVLHQLLGVFVGVAAHVAHCDLGLFAFVPRHLGELAAAFFGQCRHRHAQQVALRRRVQAEIRFADRLLDLGAHALFPRLDADRAGVEQGDVGDLTDRQRRAVVVDMHLIEDAGVGAPGAQLPELVLQRFDAAPHLCFGALLDVRNAHDVSPAVLTNDEKEFKRGRGFLRPRPAPRA